MTGPDEVVFRKQGGGWIPAWVIGRLGKKLLVRYQITSGAWRERWVQPERVKLQPEFNLETLPQWRRRYCGVRECNPNPHAHVGHTHLEAVPS